MSRVELTGCTSTPFGGFLKALGVFRLVSEQVSADTRGWWDGDVFVLESPLSAEELGDFFVDRYSPTPIFAPWNGGSGFYPKDNKEGIEAISASTDDRFAAYRRTIAICREMKEVRQGKSDDEDARRTAILRHCRNRLEDRAVEWLDACVGIAADGSRSFAPVLGTGGNEGRLDYTNNFMSKLQELLIAPDKKTPVRDLLRNALFGVRTSGLTDGAAGQYDPGRAGGANQGVRIEEGSLTNPWDLVLTMEGAVAWASGLYRRQGVSYSSILCSPFTVRPRKVGYGSAAEGDDARAEVWTPLWNRPATYREIRVLLREGRASVQGRAASNTLEFAEAACSLGVDRGIGRFVRYSLLKRRGDSYVALPAGTFPVGYRSETDRIREFLAFFEKFERTGIPKGSEALRRGVESAVYQVLLTGGQERMRELLAALGRLLRRIVTTSEARLPIRALPATPWLEACGFAHSPEVRIAAALASLWTRDVGAMADHLARNDKRFAWIGVNLPDKLAAVLNRRLLLAEKAELRTNPLGGSCKIRPGDATRFIEESVDDDLIEDLLFAFICFEWRGVAIDLDSDSAEVLPVYAVLKHLFLPGDVQLRDENKRLVADQRILSALQSGDVARATDLAVHRLRVAGLRPLDVTYAGGLDSNRLAASLLIPVWPGKALAAGIFHEQEVSAEVYV